ncbi:hypothetical protein P5673_017507 [Acropora cervicornis]|uniref:Uncharacterized protein n=1 Tax=Acropora cervicornis TaxID=6130 RepID=A0AAD9QFH3_ACRCE|nr:hypothetical protein P5673_017507 [Acropora cervicornis]
MLYFCGDPSGADSGFLNRRGVGGWGMGVADINRPPSLNLR